MNSATHFIQKIAENTKRLITRKHKQKHKNCLTLFQSIRNRDRMTQRAYFFFLFELESVRSEIDGLRSMQLRTLVLEGLYEQPYKANKYLHEIQSLLFLSSNLKVSFTNTVSTTSTIILIAHTKIFSAENSIKNQKTAQKFYFINLLYFMTQIKRFLFLVIFACKKKCFLL